MVVKKIFISHRSVDKNYAKILEDFFVKCGIPYDVIFCTSIPGNDIDFYIAEEIKNALRSSEIDIVLLSNDYYASPYCMNELGAIWYKDNSIKIGICMPEINEHTMQGFINSETKIRRMDNKSDIYKIVDIIRSYFTEQFISSSTKLDQYIENLISDYQDKIKTRSFEEKPKNESSDEPNEIERRILLKEFTVDELFIFRYVHEKQERYISEDMAEINNWLCQYDHDKSIKYASIINLIDEGIMSVNTEIVNEYDRSYVVEVGATVSIDCFRELLRLSTHCIEFIERETNQHITVNKALSGNRLDELIQNEFTPLEILLTKYIIDTDKYTLMTGWQQDKEIDEINAWQEINMINSLLSEKYGHVLNKYLYRNLIVVSQCTEYSNPKEYRIKPDVFDMFHNLSDKSNAKIENVIKENYVFDL